MENRTFPSRQVTLPEPHEGTLRHKLKSAIRRSIVDGIYGPGDPLNESELAKKFKVSRGPVREAIAQLEKENLVRCFPNRGAFVLQLSETEFDEILNMRAVLEPLAIEYAARNASIAQIQEIRSLFHMLEKSGASGNHRDFAEMDFRFHVAVWRSSGRTFLRDTLIQISSPMFVFFQINWSRYERAGLNIHEVARAHSLILDYIEQKTDLSAVECFRPVLQETSQEEKPVLMSTHLVNPYYL